MTLSVIVVGDLENGFRILGPFECASDAIDYADAELVGQNWTVFPVKRP